MTDIATAPIAITVSGLTILGIHTGLDPSLLFAGIAGGWWALSYNSEPMPLLRRISIGTVSALVGAWTANPIASFLAAWGGHIFSAWWPVEAGAASLRYMCAVMIGLLAHRQIGPLLMRRVGRLDRGTNHD